MVSVVVGGIKFLIVSDWSYVEKIGEPDDVKALGNLLRLIYELFIYLFIYLQP